MTDTNIARVLGPTGVSVGNDQQHVTFLYRLDTNVPTVPFCSLRSRVFVDPDFERFLSEEFDSFDFPLNVLPDSTERRASGITIRKSVVAPAGNHHSNLCRDGHTRYFRRLLLTLLY